MTAEITQKRTFKDQSLKDILRDDEFKRQVSLALPSLLTPERFLRIAFTTLNKTPKLLDCDKMSFINALLSLAQLGLEPDGRLAYLIPYHNKKLNIVECQLQLDYKGMAVLVWRSGLVSKLHADVVCENDYFKYSCGEVTHEIDFRKPRGKMFAVYAICKMKDGTEKHEVMSLEEIEAIRSRSKSPNYGPWATDFNEMAKKSVLKRMFKLLDWTPAIRDALEKDSDHHELTEKDVSYTSKADSQPSGSRIEQMKQKHSSVSSDTSIKIEQDTGEISLFDSLKLQLLDAKNKEELYLKYDMARSSNIDDNEKKFLDTLFVAKEKELES